MSNKRVGWLLGQLFRYADDINRLYEYSKNNSIPHGLVGNTAFELARTKTVNDALLSMHDRLNMYIGWANSNVSPECAYGLKLAESIGKITADLGEIELPERLCDNEINQMLFGYLSAAPADLTEISNE